MNLVMKKKNAYDDINLLKPEEIKAFLDDYVIGQDESKESTLLLRYIITISVLWQKKIWAWSFRRVIS